MDHSRAPVLEALEEFRRRGDVVFGPPGHKQGRGTDPRVVDVLGVDVFRSDVLTLNGLDDRRESHGVLEEAQELMADAVGAEHAFFSTCGSSLSVKTAMCSVAGPGEKLLLSRNAHKSVVAAVIINGVEPIWVHPKFDTERHMAHPPEPDDVRDRLREHPDAKGMLLITPTDWGTCADIRGVADACHAYDVPLIVDEAWGAHLPFHPDLPAWGTDADADLVVTSVHKMGGAIEQSSVFHLQHDRVAAQVLKQREDLLGTTSASSLVYGALDGWRRQMAERGRELLDAALHRAERIRAELRELPGLRVMGGEVNEQGLAAEFDRMKITMEVRDLGLSGCRRWNGCGRTGMSTWAARTAAGSPPPSPTPTTTRRRRSCWTPCAHWWRTPVRSNGGPPSCCPSRGRWNWYRRSCRARRSSGSPTRCPPSEPWAGSPPR